MQFFVIQSPAICWSPKQLPKIRNGSPKEKSLRGYYDAQTAFLRGWRFILVGQCTQMKKYHSRCTSVIFQNYISLVPNCFIIDSCQRTTSPMWASKFQWILQTCLDWLNDGVGSEPTQLFEWSWNVLGALGLKCRLPFPLTFNPTIRRLYRHARW